MSIEHKLLELFNLIQESLTEEIVAYMQAIYEFKLTGEEPGQLYVDLKHGKGFCGYGSCPHKVDTFLTMDSKYFFAMVSGKLKPSTAYFMGKLKIVGNLQKAMKLEKLIKNLKR